MSNIYEQVAEHLPNETAIGGALITMVEGTEGNAEAYNRWYEDDHFYAGCMAGPWVFAGRRYLVTRRLLRTAMSAESNSGRGRFLSVFWHTAGHLDDVRDWALSTLGKALVPNGRGFTERRHLYTAFHVHAFSRVWDQPPMADIHALDHPYGSVVLELVDAPSAQERATLVEFLREELIPASVVEDVGQCLAFLPRPFDPAMAARTGWTGQDPDRRVCLLWFYRHALDCLPPTFAEHAQRLRCEGRGELTAAIPFVATVPGTNAYADDLE